MSLPDQWIDRITFHRRESVGIDPTTQRPLFEKVVVLDDEPCDYSVRSRRIVQQTNAGTVYNKVEQAQVKLLPINGVLGVPDENDVVTVNGLKYRVDERRNFWDPGSGRFMGTVLYISRTEMSDQTVTERE